jgi:small-conductance mechanosensitive channel
VDAISPLIRSSSRLLGRAAAAVLLLVAAVPAGYAQTQDGPYPAASQDLEIETATVSVDGRVLFNVRGISSYPATRRAEVIVQQIRKAAANASITDDRVVIAPGQFGPEIRAGGERIMAVHPVDAQLESVSVDVLALAHRASIVTAIGQYRAERTPAHLLRSALIGLGATAALAAAMAALGFFWRRLDAWLGRAYQARMDAISRKVGEDVLRTAPLLRTMHGSLRTAQFVIGAILVFLWVSFTLALFPWTRWLATDLGDLVLDPLATIFAGIADYIPNLLFLVVLAFITRFGLRLLRLYFSALESGRVTLPNFEREWSVPTYKILRTLVLIVALVMAYPYLPGAGTEALRGISVFAGLLVSLGAASSVSNVIAGYLTTFGRVLRVGDLIKVGDVIGSVTQVRLLTTRVRTFRNEEVTVPNSLIMTSSLTNYSVLARERGLILQTEVGIGYEVPWRQVEAMLLEAARRTPGLLQTPAPFVLHKALGDFAVVYQLNVCKADAEGLLLTYSNLHRNVLDVFNEFGVQIMTPAYEGDPEVPKIVPREQWYAAPAPPGVAPGPAPSAVDSPQRR